MIDTHETEKIMQNCRSYDYRYCDPSFCFNCCEFEKNLRLEAHKHYDTCVRCDGLCVFSSIHLNYVNVSHTKTCNVCGGTGIYSVACE